jgi:hypothetical protein
VLRAPPGAIRTSRPGNAKNTGPVETSSSPERPKLTEPVGGFQALAAGVLLADLPGVAGVQQGA